MLVRTVEDMNRSEIVSAQPGSTNLKRCPSTHLKIDTGRQLNPRPYPLKTAVTPAPFGSYKGWQNLQERPVLVTGNPIPRA